MRIGLDIGGTKTAGVVLDDSDRVVDEIVIPTGHGDTAVLATAVTVVEELAARAGRAITAFEVIGVGIPGVVDPSTGEVSHAVNLGLRGLQLGGLLSDRFGTLVRVENDVNAAAIGVWHALDDPSVRSMAYLNLGTGLAAGLVLDGMLWRGWRGTAGEIGHIPVDPEGPECACGQRGCLELSASGAAIVRLWPTSSARPLEALYAAADAGEQAARDAAARLVHNIAAAVRVLVLTVDVQLVVIGGGMIGSDAPLLDDVRQVLDEWAGRSAFLTTLQLPSRVRLAPPVSGTAALGAALVGAGS